MIEAMHADSSQKEKKKGASNRKKYKNLFKKNIFRNSHLVRLRE